MAKVCLNNCGSVSGTIIQNARFQLVDVLLTVDKLKKRRHRMGRKD